VADVQVTVSDFLVEVNVCEQDIIVLSSEMGPQGPRGTQVLSGDSDPSPVIGLLGDQYINTTTGYLFGPKTESGWGSGVVIVRGLTANDIAYVHYQTVSSVEWNITHNLDFTPNITVVDLAGNVIEGDYKYNGNTIVATFSELIAGTAFLS
jgi:hypothetical protein